MLTLKGGDQWRCELPEHEWPDAADIRAAILADFQGAWGDRRQELVFIGTDMRAGPGSGQERLQAAMDACLLDDDEWEQWERVMKREGISPEDKKAALEELFEDG